MNGYLDFLDHELSLISQGLWLMMRKEAENSMRAKRKVIKNDELPKLCSKFKLYLKFKLLNNKCIDLSFNDLILVKCGLMLLADLTYQESLEGKDKTEYYEDFDLHFIEVWKKINNNESYKIHFVNRGK